MSNDLEQQPNSSSDGVVPSDLGGTVAPPPGDTPVGAEEKVVPLPKERKESKPRGRPPRLVKKKPIHEEEEPPAAPPKADEEPAVADPMFFAGLNTTLKMMVQQERRHRLSSMAIV